MAVDINAAITVSGVNIHIHSISASSASNKEKAYYQHRHPGHEIHYVISGAYKVTCNKNTFYISENSMLLIPPGTYHDVSSAEAGTSKVSFSFGIQKRKNALADEKAEQLCSVYNQNSPIITNLQNSEAQQTLTRLIAILNSQNDDPYKTDKLLTICVSLLLELIPHIADAAPCNQAQETDSVQEDVSFKIDSFLGTNFMHNNAKARMAEELYVSPRQLQRIMKKNYGMNYREKLSETRVQIAIDLLCNSDMPIHKIAEILGYSCSANFSAFIKRNTGKTPSQIRKEQ